MIPTFRSVYSRRSIFIISSAISTINTSRCEGDISAYLDLPDVNKYLSRRKLQTNIGELTTFSLRHESNISLNGIKDYIQLRSSEEFDDKSTIFVLDVCNGDFGSRANFGRGNNEKILCEDWCLTSFNIFLRRLMNIAVSDINESFAKNICVLGSINLSDQTQRCKNLDPSIERERNILIDSVKIQHERAMNIVELVYRNDPDNKLYYINGDHNHMTAIVEGFVKAQLPSHAASTSTFPLSPAALRGVARPVVVYIDLHADCRPVEDGPHSGTWVGDISERGLVDGVYCIGLNPLANTRATVSNMSKYGVKYEDYMWNEIKYGNKFLSNRNTQNPQAGGNLGVMANMAHDVASQVNRGKVMKPPVILSICGDSVLNLPSSAGTNTVGYSVDEVFRCISVLFEECNVVGFTIAELKTSLGDSTTAGNVGEFLTQALFVYHDKGNKGNGGQGKTVTKTVT